MRIAIINGPNLNLLGKREPLIYGYKSFLSYLDELHLQFPEVEISYFQSNVEGELVNALQEMGEKNDALVLNAAGYTHTSVALGDTVASLEVPVVEVHISNLHARESFRMQSYTGAYADGIITGLGLDGYRLALDHLLNKLKSN